MSHKLLMKRMRRIFAFIISMQPVILIPFVSFFLFGAAPNPEPHHITLLTAMQFNEMYSKENAYHYSFLHISKNTSSSQSIQHHDFFSENTFLKNVLLAAIVTAWDCYHDRTSIDLPASLDDSTGKTRNPGVRQFDPAAPGQFQSPKISDPRFQPGMGNPPGSQPLPGSTPSFNPPSTFGGTPPDSGQPIPQRPPADSTARVKHLTYEPKHGPVVPPTKPRVHPFFIEPKGQIQYIVHVDTARNIVHIRELFNGKDIRIPLDLPLNEYIKLRYEYERNRRTYEFVSKPSEKKDALGNIFKNLTEIEIPVPPNPLMSIFGNRNVVSLRITGAVDISAGFRSEKSDQQSVFLNTTQNTPTFKQQVQVNVSGMIGDKLSISADWSTERTFEYENQLKIQYKGYEDEIVQNIEAGNVSLQTPSGLVGGSGALFGIKGEFQFGPLHLTAIASQKKGEGSRLSISGGSQESKFEKHAYQYSENHYFIDAAYTGSVYEDYYNYRAHGYTLPVSRSDLYIKDIEVWVTQPTSIGVVIDPLARDAVAIIDPDFDFPNVPNAKFPSSYDLYIDPNEKVLPVAGEIEVGKFKKLNKDVDYTYNELTGIITLNQSIQDDQVLAAAYKLQNVSPAANDDRAFGTFVSDPRLGQKDFKDDQGKPIPPRLVLKLIKPRNLNPSFKETWKLPVRSIFSLGARNLKKEDIASIKLVYRSGGTTDDEFREGINLLQLFGLDQTDDNGGNQPDNKIDLEHVDLLRGEIIFPTTRPWDTGLADFFKLNNIDESRYSKYLYPAVYDTTQVIARQSDRDKILIVGITKGSSSATYQLGFNLVPGSVKVYLNGQPLIPNTDYRIDEQVGLLTITKEEALMPNAKVDIDYERQDLFSFASKTLLGVRGEVNLGKESAFGFSILNFNQKTLSDKVRIGEEPMNNTIMGFDARTRFDLPFITDALNRLPFISTNEKSFIQLQAEGALMIPDPNTKKSPISSDHGAGIAYIDDFEGSRLFAPLQTAYSIWKMASVPANHPMYIDLTNSQGEIVDSIMQSHRARFNWYNLPVAFSNVNVTQIWPNRKAALENQKVNILEMEYHPRDRGMYNYTPNTRDSALKSWGGVMRLLPINAYNLIDGNYNYIELWMKVETQQRGTPIRGKMIIDVGKISEDVIPNKKLDTEDDAIPGSIRNGILNPGEDIGLDVLANDQELVKYTTEIQQYGDSYPDMKSDPSGDNYNYNSSNWSEFNGTEGNIKDIAGQFPDTEDLNTNGILDLNNAYFQYEVDLDTTKTQSTTPGSYIVGGGFPNDSWFQFRIPITDYKRTIGNPSLTDVQYIRVWFTDVTDTIFKVRVAEFNFVGNQWIERIKNDPKFSVSVVNIEDNPEYTSAPGVIRPRDRTRPDQDILGNEQSLALIFKDLPDDTTREAVRYFPNGTDLFNYSRMKMFVHGDDNARFIDDNNYNQDIVLRMGVDTINYYEYRQPIRPGWDACNEVDIDFGKLTAIKPMREQSFSVQLITFKTPDGRDTSRYDTTIIYKSIDVSVGNGCGAVMRVVGRPDLIRVNFISVGVHNPVNNSPPGPISGEVWINELRVTDVKDQSGIAYQGSMNLRLADFADVNATINHSDPYFHGLTDRFKQDRSYTTNWSATTTINLDRVLPKSWNGTQMRVTYSHAENLRKPLLLPGEPDVEVEKTIEQTVQKLQSQGATPREIDYQANRIRIASQTFEVRDSWAFPTVRLKAPGEHWLITDVLNRLELSYNYSIARSRDPILEQRRQWQWTARANYGIDLSRDLYISPFKSLFRGVFLLDDYKDWKLFYSPNRFTVTGDMTRTREERRDRATSIPRPYERLFEHSRSLSLGYQLSENGLLNIGGSYTTSMRTSLLRLETDPTKPLGYEQRQSSEIFHDIFFGRGGIYLGDPLSFDQQISINSRPKIPKIFDLDRYFEVSASYQVAYRWQTNLQQGSLGRAAGYNANTTAQINFRLKSLFDPLFKFAETPAATEPARLPTPGRRSSRSGIDTTQQTKPDSTALAMPGDTAKAPPTKISFANIVAKSAYYLIKVPFLDYENINFSFNQSTMSTASGVRGMSGFNVFWTSNPFNPNTDPDLGPSRFYQLGLIRTPNPRHEKLAFKSSFPFITIEGAEAPGIRALNVGGSYIDNYSQNNTITLKTYRDLWEGVKVDLGWDVKWQLNKNTQILTQQGTDPIIQSEQTSSSIERSYLMFPDFLFFKFFNTNMTSVNEKFQRLQSIDPTKTGDNLAQAFEEGFEALPFLSKFFSGMMPRINWGIRWDGVEKLPLLSKIADRISLEHRYKSTVATKYRGNNGEPMIIESKRVQYDFSPLLGVTLGFNKLWGGDLSVNGSWRTQTGYDLNTSASNIVQNGSTEISITANFRKTGFELPLFGISLKNDLDVSMAFSTNKSSSYTYQINELDSGGQPREGTTRITFEPRIRYVISQRVTSSLFFRYQRTKPDAAVGSRIPGTTIYEGGLEIRLSITGS